MKTIIPIIMLLAAFAGCSVLKDNVTQDARHTITYASESSAALNQRLVMQQSNLEKLETFIAKDGIPLLESAGENNAAAMELLNDIKNQIKQLRADMDQIDADYKRLNDEYQHLKNKTSVKIALFIESAVKWFVAIWIILGVGGAALTAFMPGGSVLYIVGKELIRLLPFANPFSWIRGLVGGDSAKAVKP